MRTFTGHTNKSKIKSQNVAENRRKTQRRNNHNCEANLETKIFKFKYLKIQLLDARICNCPPRRLPHPRRRVAIDC